MTDRPEARDLIIQHMDFSQYELFERLTGDSSSVNWPYADSDLFIVKGDGKQLVLNPVFISHIRNISNWTVGPQVVEAFPFLSGWPTTPPTRP